MDVVLESGQVTDSKLCVFFCVKNVLLCSAEYCQKEDCKNIQCVLNRHVWQIEL
jgi:hypothetical protein